MSSACRSCNSHPLQPILSLGPTPLANGLLTREMLERPEPTYPLDLAFCPACSLVQLTETVPPETLFSDYPYCSSFSDTAVASARHLAERLIKERSLNETTLVMEIASNDGYLLQHYRNLGVSVLGIEPAANVARLSAQKGIPTRCDFFGRRLARELAAEGSRADVVHANNVLAHVPDLNGLIEGLAQILKPAGLGVIEVPYVRDLIEQCEFDTIYHEHLCYFSVTALHSLLTRHGMRMTDVEYIPLHGGSLRYFVEAGQGKPTGEAAKLLRAERAAGMLTLAYYQDFANRISTLQSELVALLRNLKADGKRLAAYGASAKGSTLLNVFKIGRDMLDFVVDRSPMKQGRFTPGTHLPILPTEALLDRRPDFVLLLTWNFADEILEQQRAYCAQGGRFIIPLPVPRTI